MALTWKRLCALGAELPEVVEGTWWRTPALSVRGRSFVRLKEDGRTVVFLVDGVGEQEALVASRPAIYHITDHYRGYGAVLAHLRTLTVAEARDRLEGAWRRVAPRALVSQLDPTPPAPRRRRGPRVAARRTERS